MPLGAEMGDGHLGALQMGGPLRPEDTQAGQCALCTWVLWVL